MTRFVDLSQELDSSPSERLPIVIERVGHAEGALQMSELFGIPAERLPDGLGWAGEQVSLTTHSGTHMDAPWHYGPRSGEGRAAFISEVPLDWCFGAGVVLDLSGLSDGAEIGVADLEGACTAIGRPPESREIVLLRTGADAAWGSPDYPERGAGLSRAGLDWLLDRGVRVVGTDAWGLDRPFGPMRRAFESTRDASARGEPPAERRVVERRSAFRNPGAVAPTAARELKPRTRRTRWTREVPDPVPAARRADVAEPHQRWSAPPQS